MVQTCFNIPLKIVNNKNILEKVSAHVRLKKDFFHIVSLNPEIIVLSQENKAFLDVLQSANIHILDGVGVVFAAHMCGISNPVRITGVDLMKELVAHGADQRFRIMFLGGSEGLAERVASCYKNKHPNGVFAGLQGISNIKDSEWNKDQQNTLFKIREFRPDMLFVAFGSPHQELWLWRNRDKLKGIVCMGVGGGFDFVAGTIPRAPRIVRSAGLEWLYRLVKQPWRWRRQLRLVKFVWLVVIELGGIVNSKRNGHLEV